MQLDNARSLAWRLERHGLVERSDETVEDVVDRVVALRGWPADLTEMAVVVRQSDASSGVLEDSLTRRDIIRSYAFRGGSYVFTHEIGAVLLSVHTASRSWEKERFQRQAGFELHDWELLRDAVRDLLASGPRTRDEIATHLAGIPKLRHLATAAAGAGADTLYKPLHWWGDICFGPSRDGRATFRLLTADPAWPGLPDVDDAGRAAIELYLGAYGPATTANLLYWLAEGLGAPRRRVVQWLADLGERITQVTVNGMEAYVCTTDMEAIMSAESTEQVHLLPGFDPWVLGPGTADTRILSAERRAVGTRGAHLVIRGGVVCGVWRRQRDELTVTWFDEAGSAPGADLEAAVRPLAGAVGETLSLSVRRSGD